MLASAPGAWAAAPTFRIEVHVVPTLPLTHSQLLALAMLHGDAGAIANQVASVE